MKKEFRPLNVRGEIMIIGVKNEEKNGVGNFVWKLPIEMKIKYERTIKNLKKVKATDKEINSIQKGRIKEIEKLLYGFLFILKEASVAEPITSTALMILIKKRLDETAKEMLEIMESSS